MIESCGWDGTLWLCDTAPPWLASLLCWPPRIECLLGAVFRTHSFLLQLYPAASQPQPQPQPHPQQQQLPLPSVTTHFFTLVREHFRVEAKLASTHLFRFRTWTHLASPIGSQWMAHRAHGLGEDMRMRMRDGGSLGGVRLYTPLTSRILIFQPHPRVTAVDW